MVRVTLDLRVCNAKNPKQRWVPQLVLNKRANDFFGIGVPTERGSEHRKSERRRVRTSKVFVRMIRTSKV